MSAAAVTPTPCAAAKTFLGGIRVCNINGCEKPHDANGLCCSHAYRLRRYGNPLEPVRQAPKGTGYIDPLGYRRQYDEHGNKKGEHIIFAEKALGRPLPLGAVVHHHDRNRSNNSPGNLVICPDKAYHKLLHRRMEAKAATGDANKLKCQFCKQWDSRGSIVAYAGASDGFMRFWHYQCKKEYDRRRRSNVATTRRGY